jgi:hypothetical protein
MSKFIGRECQACCEKFTVSDAVVVCPDCGTLHHRSCYDENGECINLAEHERILALESAVNVLKQFEKTAQRLKEADFEEPNIRGVSKAELSSFMQIEPDSPEFASKVSQVRVISPNIFAGLLAPFYQFYKGMRFAGIVLLVFPLFAHYIPFAVLSLFMFLFNDYIYFRVSVFKIKQCRKFYTDLPPDMQEMISYHDFLRTRGKPSLFRSVAETFIAFFMLLAIIRIFGLETMLPALRALQGEA